MASQLKNVLTFSNVGAGHKATLPHGLYTNTQVLPPDLILLLNPNFDVVLDATFGAQLTVINNGSGSDSCDVYVEYWQQVTGIDPAARTVDLLPSPTIVRSAQPGSGSTSGQQIKVNYVATGSEGTDFHVSIGLTLASSVYEVLWAPKGVTQIPSFDFPDGAGDRTTTTFRAVTTAPLIAGDKYIFILFL